MTVDRRPGGLVAVGGTLGCHYDNSCCHRWLRGWRVDDLRFSVTVWVHDISRCICVCVIIFANVFHVNLSNKRLLNLNLNLIRMIINVLFLNESSTFRLSWTYWMAIVPSIKWGTYLFNQPVKSWSIGHFLGYHRLLTLRYKMLLTRMNNDMA